MFRLMVKLGSLGAFCGGPLYVADLWRPWIGQDKAFVASFAPLALMIFGWLTAAEEEELGWFGRLVVHLGAAGAGGLITQNAFALAELQAGVVHPNAQMIAVGSLIGFVVAGFFALDATRALSRSPASESSSTAR